MRYNKIFSALSAVALMSTAQAAPLSNKGLEHNLTHNLQLHKQQQLHHGIESQKAIDTKSKNVPQAQSVFKPVPTKLQTTNSAVAQAAVACDINAFTTSNTSNLISAITSQGTTCVNELFSAQSSTQQAVYNSTKMVAVANHAQTLSQSYQGGGDDNIQALFLWLRAGLYVEFYNDAVTFDSSAYAAVRGAIDAFVANSHFYDNNDAHGKTLAEVVITMDSVEGQDVYLPVAKQWLSRWSQSHADKWYMRTAVNNFFTLLFRGQWNDNYKTIVATDSELVTILRDFSLDNWMLGTDAEFMIANAGRELGRLKAFGGTIQPAVDAALNTIFSTYQVYGYGDAVYLGAADTASYHGDCNTYNICNFKATLESNVLAQTHICSPTIKIRSQNMTAAQHTAACSKMAYEETYFHNKLQTNNTPVPDDNNTQLQVNIFDSSDDYKKYAGPIFGINTNNGGMYLEGDPSVQGNVPNFIAYEATYANPDHYVWNLEHEYVHYLDGRFDLYGDFNAPTEAIVWWSEGVAEYVANEDDNQAAIDTIKDGSVYDLATIFATTYDGFDQDRIYRWGYLAVRFMFERHNNEVNLMLNSTRNGNWSAYKSRIDQWATAYDSEFTQWTQDLANGSGGGSNVAPTANANGPYSGNTGAAIAFSSNGSSDSDGTISSYSWNFGDGNSSSSANPSHSYSAPGTYTVTLTVTDDDNATDTASATVTVTDGPGGSVLSNGVAVSVSGAQDSETHFTLDVPANAADLSFVITGGSGDADLYVRQGSAPTTSSYDCRPWKGGNEETCDISNIQAGTYYVMLRGYNSFNNVSLTGSYTTSGSNVPDACASSGPVTGGSLEDGVATCLGSADPIWLSIGNVNGHSSIAISIGNGSGDVNVDYKTGGWPSASDNHGSSNNAGTDECIYINNLNSSMDYWGYFKISGGGSGASIVVDFDTADCR